ncbi:MAG: hypothetical protein KDC54_04745, partial [Lewinella sp.]|nr:hypothetical protein [Lewinella sp.]
MAAASDTRWAKNNLPAVVFLATAVAISIVSALFAPDFYSKILGALNPIVVFPICGLLAYFSLRYIQQFEVCFIAESLHTKDLLQAFFFSVALGSMPVIIDLWAPFPKDINVLFPASLAFYPTIGVLAEIVFHLLPVTLLLIIFGQRILAHVWVIIVLVGVVEPLFQVLLGRSADGPGLKDALVFVEVFIFS